MATKSVASRDDAITAWNDIAGRWTGPTVGKPIKREPLPGWSQGFLEGMPETIGACLGFPRDSGKTQWFVELAYTHVSGESASPQLAAEDAARAMVADMAAALGGSVTWPTEGGE